MNQADAVSNNTTSMPNGGISLNGGIIGALSSLANAGINAYQNYKNREFQSEQAQINRDFQLEMYQRQLDDSIDWRTHQEEYNSPKAQMQRYRDAGINPMYAVTGGNGNMVTTPMTANGSGYGANVGNPQNHRIELDPVVVAQVKLLNSQAKNYQADAALKYSQAAHQDFLNGVDNALMGVDFGGKNYHQYKAEVTAAALRYESQLQGMDFEEKKKVFLHNDYLRQFEKDFDEQELDQLKAQVAKAKSEADIQDIAKNWAKTHHWIDATTDVVGMLLSLVGLAKGTSLMPFVTNSETPYVNERNIYGNTEVHNYNN